MSILTNWMHARFGGKRGFCYYLKHTFKHVCKGAYKQYMALPNAEVKRVVFVCKGNICRSAFAETAFRELTDFPVASFGLDTTTGCPAHPPIISQAELVGFDLSQHVTTNVSEFVPENGDLYVCTEPAHVEQTLSHYPRANVVLLGAFGPQKTVFIQDPYSGKSEYIKYVVGYINAAVAGLCKELNRHRA